MEQHPELTVTVIEEGGEAVVRCAGAIQVATQAPLREALARLAGAVRRVVIDLEAVDVVDASGLAVLATCANDFEAVAVRRPAAPVREALVRTGLDAILQVRSS